MRQQERQQNQKSAQEERNYSQQSHAQDPDFQSQDQSSQQSQGSDRRYFSSGYNSISAVEVEKYLSGVDFPCRKAELVECATNNDASQEILDLLNGFPDQEFRSPVDVAQCIGRARH